MSNGDRSPTRVRGPLVLLLALAFLALSYFLMRPIFSDGEAEIFPERKSVPSQAP